MAFLNYAKKEISAKIVFYGPGLSGKTTNLECIHKKLQPDRRGKLISLETRTDRTLFFDFLPVQFGEINGFQTRFNVYTVPGQIFYNETRKMVLKGVDGVVFVADSQREMANENVESFRNLEENLKVHGRKLHELPLVFQYNKRDLSKILSLDELNRLLNPRGIPFFEAVAIRGDGVLATLTRITRMVAEKLQRSEKDTFSAPARPSMASPNVHTHPVVESKDTASPKVIPFPSEATPVVKHHPGEAMDAPRPYAKDEPRRPEEKVPDSLGEPEAVKTPAYEIGPILAGDSYSKSVPGEDIPSIGDLSRPTDLLSDSLSDPQRGILHSPEFHTKAPSPTRDMGHPHSDSFGIDPSLRLISHPRGDPGTSEQKADAHMGRPERVGNHRVHIPLSFTFPGKDQTFSFTLVIDLKPTP